MRSSFLWCAVVLTAATALAAQHVSEAETALRSLRSIGLVMAIVAFFRRKHEIGGWLMYFFTNVFLGLTLTLLTFVGSLPSYAPRLWKNPIQYIFFLLATIPPVLVMVCLAGSCVALLRSSAWVWVVRVRMALAAYLVISLVRVAIDAIYFPDALWSAEAALFYPAIFLPYLFLSKRVRHVFQTHDWYLVTDPRRAAGTLGLLPPRPLSGFGLPEAEHRAGGIDDDA